jgi:replicative DNA helicase
MSERYPGEEAERAILGMMMISEGALGVGLEVLKAHHFHDQAYRTLFTAIAAVDDAGLAVDTVTVMDMAGSKMEPFGGWGLIMDLTDYQPVANVRHTAKLVYERAVNRRLERVGKKIAEVATDELSVQERDAKIDRLLHTIYETTAEGEEPPLADGVAEALQETEALAAGESFGVPSGFTDLDKMLGGFRKGQLIILASRPGMGKTALGSNIAQNVATAGIPALVFSIEMPTVEMAGRFISRQAQVAFDRMRTNTDALTADDWTKLRAAAAVVSAQPLHVDDRPPYTMASIRARARRAVRSKGIRLIVIDYLQLLQTDLRGENRQTDVAEISRSMKMLARELEVPVLAMAQLNRAVEKRDNKRPGLSDLRDSGAIEQDADIVIFPWREGYYEPEVEERAELIVAKHRNGKVGTVFCRWKAPTVEFTDTTRRRIRSSEPPEEDPWHSDPTL